MAVYTGQVRMVCMKIVAGFSVNGCKTAYRDLKA